MTNRDSIRFADLDARIASFMGRWGVPALRVSLAIIFVWFGILKPLGLSPAEDLVLATVGWLPLLDPGQWLAVIGWWEVAIGVTFLSRRTLRLAIALLALQMVGTFLPLVLLPEVAFQPGRIPYAPTLEGQYIIKNLLILSAALVVGGTVRRDRARGLATPGPEGLRRPFRVEARRLGLHPGVDLDDVAGLVDRLDGPTRR